ncbi:hypothetical protein L596_014610 [Steinernema carpocapsae]|uniref:Impact N-terminal domain-containing protein n=1 Tax=Steinernema carpocapsae TaxID=34508 RepID=A0A4U5ND74_STECR|nr:hypothetical protein L596_014610 [Steinernema carpocapsae]
MKIGYGIKRRLNDRDQSESRVHGIQNNGHRRPTGPEGGDHRDRVDLRRHRAQGERKTDCREVLRSPRNHLRSSLGLSFKSPPTFQISGSTLSHAQKLAIDGILQATYDNVGSPVLFAWIDAVLGHLSDLQDDEGNSEEEEETQEEDEKPKSEDSGVLVPEIVSSDTLTDRKSVFQAHAAKITSKEEAMAVLAKLMENTKIARATHNIYAWIVRRSQGEGKPDFKAHDCDDDGETGAASKVLNMMINMGTENVMVVVTRWYGGIHLGPDRFRHINNIARQVLVENGFAETKGAKKHQ